MGEITTLNSAVFFMIGISAMSTVGLIEVLKNFFKPKQSKIWTLVMIPLALASCLVYIYLPIWVMAGILTVCACQIGWDIILKTFEKIISRIGDVK